MSEQKIIYTYKHTKPEDFSHIVNFSESDFSKELEKVFETKINVERVNVEFIFEKAHAKDKFTCVIRPDFNAKLKLEIIEKGDDFVQVVRNAIHKTIQETRHIKDKFDR